MSVIWFVFYCIVCLAIVMMDVTWLQTSKTTIWWKIDFDSPLTFLGGRSMKNDKVQLVVQAGCQTDGCLMPVICMLPFNSL